MSLRSGTPRVVATRAGKKKSDVVILQGRIEQLESLVLELRNSLLKTTNSVACQTDSDPLRVQVDVSVSTEPPPQKELAWTEVRRKGPRPPQGRKGRVADSASSITVVNRFSHLDVEGDDESHLSADVMPSPSQSPEVHLIGDSIVRGVRVGRPGKATTWCYPGTRVEHLTTRVRPVLKRSGRNPVLVVHAGTNNVPMDSPKGVAERLRHLIQEARRVRSGVRIVVSSVLPRFDRGRRNSGDLSSSVRQTAREMSLLCSRERVMFVDASQALLRNPGKHYARDGLHLTVAGKAVLGSFLEKAVRRLDQGN